MMSSLIGKSKAIQVYINSSDHNYNVDKLLNAVRVVMPQNQWGSVELQLYVGNGVQLVSSTTGAPCLDFGYLSSFIKITLENNGTILGRGGNGGGKDRTKEGYPGGTAIRRNATLYINNRGVIGGGGGGGGGAPFGSGGLGYKVMSNQGANGQNASFSGAGAGGGGSGAGGWYGQRGVTAYDPFPGGAAGAAVDGGGTFGWINRGTVYGSAP